MHLACTIDVAHDDDVTLDRASSLLTSLMLSDSTTLGVLKPVVGICIIRLSSFPHASGHARYVESPLLPRVGETTSDERILRSEFGPCGGPRMSDSPKRLSDEMPPCEGHSWRWRRLPKVKAFDFLGSA
jgi:hypothetical protein